MQDVIGWLLVMAGATYISYYIIVVNYKLAQRYGHSYRSDMPHSTSRGIIRLFGSSSAMALGLSLFASGNLLIFLVSTFSFALCFVVLGVLVFRVMLEFFN